ncbi:porin [Aquabacterium sp.]|uniref:porin n=1 Tax=Aquabacterium sp. TaxID=1872578 RepID=UPI0035AEE3EC
MAPFSSVGASVKPGALHHADVKAYGTIDMSFGSFEGFHAKGSDTRATKVESGAMTTSFIGFGGSEDLGGGLKAEFALESFLHADTGGQQNNWAGGFWGRDSYVALSGGFGRVIAGQYDNAFYGQCLSYSAFSGSFGFSPSTILLFGDYGYFDDYVVGLGFDTSWVNSLTYESPNFGGFTFSAQFSPKEVVSSNPSSRDSYTLSGNYSAGPLSLGLNYAVTGYNSTAYLAKKNAYQLGASYDFGVLKVMGQYAEAKTKDGSDTIATLKSYELSIAVPVTAEGTVLAAYGEAKYTGDYFGDTFKRRILSLAYDHRLSKRTDVYAAFKYDGASSLESGDTFAVGIRHAF